MRQMVDMFGDVIREGFDRRPMREREGECCEVCGAPWYVSRNGNSASRACAVDCNDRRLAIIREQREAIRETTRRVLMRTKSRWAVR